MATRSADVTQISKHKTNGKALHLGPRIKYFSPPRFCDEPYILDIDCKY